MMLCVRSAVVRRATRLPGVIAAVLLGAIAMPLSRAADATAAHAPTANATVRIASEEFDLDTETDLNRLAALAAAMIELSRTQAQARHEERRALTNSQPLADLPREELKRFFAEPADLLSKKSRRGFQELADRVEILLRSSGGSEREPLLREIQEIASAVKNNARKPAPEQVEIMQAPFLIWDYTHHGIGGGSQPAANLATTTGWSADFSRIDPLPSSFWQRPGNIASLDLASGFGRAALPRTDDRIYSYGGPKTSFGSKPGFEVRNGTQELKVKFGEPSEPFVARVFAALGYHVEPVDYTPGLKVRYDRRLFREFNLRRPLRTEVRLLGMLPVWIIELQEEYDPCAFIAGAVLKDGTPVSRDELKHRLLTSDGRHNPAHAPDGFDSGFEEEIDHLITVPAVVQYEDDGIHSIGPWDFNALGHEHLRELRGMGLLAAWLGWHDARYDNTRLKIVRTARGVELRHFISDLGQALGKSDTGFTPRRAESPEDFPWTFTRPKKEQGPGRMTIPFRVTGYEPIERVRPFEEMTEDDARWMARLIAQLTERQITQALIASGYSPENVRLYSEKLIRRRDRMIQDLGLEKEFPALRPLRAGPEKLSSRSP